MTDDKTLYDEWKEDEPFPEAMEGSQLGSNIRDENGNILYNPDVVKLLQSYFGDGSDGDVEITTNTVLTRDMFYNNLRLKENVILYPSGYRIHVRQKLTREPGAKIVGDGNDGGDGQDGDLTTGGAGGLPGAALSSGSLYGSLAGKIGGDGGGYGEATDPGVNGDDLAKCLGNDAVGGGKGGDGDGGVGGAASIGGSKTGTVYNLPRTAMSIYLMVDFFPSIDVLKTNPSAGSGAGGGMGSNATRPRGGGGGGSASGGRIIDIFARKIVKNGDLTDAWITSKGGKGGDGGDGKNYFNTWYSGGGGGGAGGNGGIIRIVYISKTGTVTTDVSGGAKGIGGLAGGGTATAGDDGTAGVAGNVIELKI